jgi:hypothetical protein
MFIKSDILNFDLFFLHIDLLGHIILIQYKPVFDLCLLCYVGGGEAENTNITISCLILPEIERKIYLH